MKKKGFYLLLLALIFPNLGFVCASRVEKMEADISALRVQFQDIQKRTNKEQAEFTEMMNRVDAKLKKLDEDQAAQNERVSQSSVELSMALEAEKRKLAQMQGRLEQQEHTMGLLQQALESVLGRAVATGTGQTVVLPQTEAELLQFIEVARAAGDAGKELAGSEEFLRLYPQSPEVERLMGRVPGLHLALGANDAVITASTAYVKVYPKGQYLGDAIYAMGAAAANVGNCELARKSFKYLSDSGDARGQKGLTSLAGRCP